MGITTGISWCDSTANPIVGCDGCELHRAGDPNSHCYASGLVGRYAGIKGWPKSFDRPEFFAGRIEKACRWSDLTGTAREDKPWLNGYPRIIFLNDLSDSFTESLPVDWMAPFLPMMATAPHIWILCTKRPKRARVFFETYPCPSNFWLLTTVTSQANAGRIAELLAVPDVTVRGVSMEPLLGPVDLTDIRTPCGSFKNALTGEVCSGESGCSCGDSTALDWVILGGESGPGARPMLSHWAFDILDQCGASEAPCFFKQWSEWIDCGCSAFGRANYGPARHMRSDGTEWPAGQVPQDENADVVSVVRAGVKAAGVELAGAERRGMPRWSR